jgi:acetate kinase
MSKILAVNAGSSSLKFKVYRMPEEQLLCSGIADRIGDDNGSFSMTIGQNKFSIQTPMPSHETGVKLILKYLLEKQVILDYADIAGIGHRVVQGGKHFQDSVLMTEEVVEKIKEYIPLAPLHNYPNLMGYLAFKKVLPQAKHIAVFDTAFHQTMAMQDFLFPIPYELYEQYDIRRYGFHGTSHKYLTSEAFKLYTKKKDPKIITLHIGSGASLAAIQHGKVVATSMGLTPLGGIMMGTRTGDIDPSVLHFVAIRAKKTHEEVYELFNKKSGLLGVSGLSNDSRDLEAAHLKGHPRAQLANQLFVRRIADFIGQYHIRLGGVDVLVFSAGIGENSGFYRKLIIDEVKDALGIVLDEPLNQVIRGKTALITRPESKVDALVIPTNEELMIVRDTFALI